MIEFLFSPLILFFVFGFFAQRLGADLNHVKGLSPLLSAYLLIAIGFKGGTQLQGIGFYHIVSSMILLFALCAFFSCVLFWGLKRYTKLHSQDTISIVMHYGSVSAVTFLASVTYAEIHGETVSGSSMVMLSLLEIWGVVVALFLFELSEAKKNKISSKKLLLNIKKVLLTEGPFLLLVGLGAGFLSEKNGHSKIDFFFKEPFTGVLCLFLLVIGVKMGESVSQLGKRDVKLIGMAVIYPLLIGVGTSYLFATIGYSVADSFCMAALLSSASYIAAPAVAQECLPKARLSLSLGLAIGITFPFNLLVGVPLYASIAKWAAGGS